MIILVCDTGSSGYKEWYTVRGEVCNTAEGGQRRLLRGSRGCVLGRRAARKKV